MWKLNSSTAQQLDRLIFSLLAIVLLTAAVVGCEDALPAGTVGLVVVEPSTTCTEIDAGIVFADRESYLCLSFERLGLADGEVATSVSSSCECIQPSVVSYRSTPGPNAYAVLLRFVKENRMETTKTELEPSEVSVATPAHLGVLIDLKLADGSGKQFTVNVLRTSLAREVAP